jgi:fluoride exporter
VRFFLICLAGAIGTGTRYAVGGWAARTFALEFPYGTLAINATGSFLIGLIQQLAIPTSGLPETLRAAIVIGFLGGFTTYSAFSHETLELAGRGAWLSAALYVLTTTGLCLGLCAVGIALGRSLTGSR